MNQNQNEQIFLSHLVDSMNEMTRKKIC